MSGWAQTCISDHGDYAHSILVLDDQKCLRETSAEILDDPSPQGSFGAGPDLLASLD